jgi:tRNA 2-thiouridine synthesizing protein E
MTNEQGDPLERFVEDAEQLRIDTDVDSQQRANRERQLAHWNPARGRELAAAQGITLGEEHLAVVEALRAHYLEHGEVEDGRILEALLEQRFAAQGGKTYLHRLFPDGPVTQGLRIAELPLPPHTVDAGFGTAR